MKRTLYMILLFLLLLPNSVYAHSTLESAVPAQDATLSEAPSRIEMTFNTDIAKLSSFKVINELGEEVSIGVTEVQGNQLSGPVTDQLANGIYAVKWTIIGEDGHTISGDYNFTVNAPAATEQPSAPDSNAPSSEEETNVDTSAERPAEAENTEQADAQNTEGANPSSASEQATSNQSKLTPLYAVGALIVVFLIASALRNRRRRT